MCLLTQGERFKDARIVHNQHGKQSIGDVVKGTGVSGSLISDLENGKDRKVNYSDIVKLAKYYGVSLDWLLGLTEVRTLDMNARAISEATGLSEKSVSELINRNLVRKQAFTMNNPHVIEKISELSRINGIDFSIFHTKDGNSLLQSLSKSVYDELISKEVAALDALNLLLEKETSYHILLKLARYLRTETNVENFNLCFHSTLDSRFTESNYLIDSEIVIQNMMTDLTASLTALRNSTPKKYKIIFRGK